MLLKVRRACAWLLLVIILVAVVFGMGASSDPDSIMTFLLVGLVSLLLIVTQ